MSASSISIRSLVALAVLLHSFSVSAKEFKSGEYITRGRYGFGAFEARIRAAEGPGVISTFFLWKPGSEIPSIPWEEIDFELGPAGGDYQTQIMTPGPPERANRTEHNIYHALGMRPWDAYYTYRIEWTPDSIAFFVDGAEVRREVDPVEYAALFNTDSSGDTPIGERMEVRLGAWPALPNIYGWAGTFDAGSLPTAVFVDYIKIWDYTPNQADPFSTLILYDEFDAVRESSWYFAEWTFEFSASDYIRRNVGVKDSRLVVAVTTEAGQGSLPDPPVDDSNPTQGGIRIEAEDYDAAHDATPGNFGDAACSSSDVDAQRTADVAGGTCNIGWTSAGEWLEYFVEIPEDADYDLRLRIASLSSDNQLHVEVDGSDVSGPVAGPGNGWQAFSDEVVPDLFLPAGVHLIRLVFDRGEINVNYLDFVTIGSTPAPDPNENQGPGSISAVLRVTTDWGGGYCADLVVSSSMAVSTWLATIQTPGASIYTSWNLTSTGSGPAYAIAPVSSNASIGAGSSQTVGFCANRTNMSSAPVVVSVTGS